MAEASGVYSWTEYDLHLFVACFVRARFPIVVVLNKADLPEARENVARVRAALGGACVAASARTEWWLYERQRRGHLHYEEGGGADTVKLLPGAPPEAAEHLSQIRTKVLVPFGSTGVLEALSLAVLQRRPVF